MLNCLKNTVLVLFAALLSFGCYHKKINSRAEYKGGAYLPDSQFVVFRKIKFFRRPKGLTRFPDGGISKVLHRNTSLYRVDLDAGKAQLLHNFDDTGEPFFSGAHISYRDSFLLYSSYRAVYSEGQAILADLGIYILDLRSNYRRKLSEKGRRAVLSADAEKVVFLHKGHVYIYKRKTKAHIAVAFPKNTDPAYLKFFADTLYLFSMDGNWRYDRETQVFVPDTITYEKNYGQDPIPYKALKAIPDSVWGAYLENNELIVPD